MKKINSLLVIAFIAILSLTSCKSDDDGSSISEGEVIANTQNETEDSSIAVTSLENGVSIENASKLSGTPPASNSELDFNLNSDAIEAFQETGLKIQFSSDESIAGAYILFKDLEGNTIDNYFDVPATAFNSVYNKGAKSSKKGVLKNIKESEKMEDFNDEIQIDFSAVVPAGKFCYDICLYDTENNVSQIQTVCVTVEAWGGNASIVGEWLLDRIEGDDDLETFDCDNGDSITAVYSKEIKNDITLVLNQDGTYYLATDREEYDIDYEATTSTCTAVYEDEIDLDNDKYSGNWAFNEEIETLTTVDFKYEDFLFPEYNEEIEDGELGIEGAKTEVISDQLVLTFDLSDGEIGKAYFNRK